MYTYVRFVVDSLQLCVAIMPHVISPKSPKLKQVGLTTGPKTFVLEKRDIWFVNLF